MHYLFEDIFYLFLLQIEYRQSLYLKALEKYINVNIIFRFFIKSNAKFPIFSNKLDVNLHKISDASI